MPNIALLLVTLLAAVSCSGPEPGSEKSPEPVAAHVRTVALDERDAPVVILEEDDGPGVLHIWIGPTEARSIAAVMEDLRLPRPNTHDLAVRILRTLEGEVDRVVVTDLRQGVYFAVMSVRDGDDLFEIDARPSDAIAFALRVGAPVFVNPELFTPSPTRLHIDAQGREVRHRTEPPQEQIEST